MSDLALSSPDRSGMPGNEDYVWGIDDPRGYANAMGRYRTRRERDFLRAHLKGNGLRILDVGGGVGRFAVPLADQGHQVTVADLSSPAIQALRARHHRNIEAVQGDFCELRFDALFDAVIAIESVQYFVGIELETLFTKIATVLRPGGMFIFTGLNDKSWRYRLHLLRRPNAPRYRVADPSAFGDALQSAGFTISRLQGFVWMPFPADSNSPLIPLAATLERALGLDRWLRQSPWLLIASRRR